MNGKSKEKANGVQVPQSTYMIGVIPEEAKAENLGTSVPYSQVRGSARKMDPVLKKKKIIPKRRSVEKQRKRNGSPLSISKRQNTTTQSAERPEVDTSF